MRSQIQLTSAEYLRSINKSYSQLTADENKEYHRCHRRTSKRHKETADERSAYNVKYLKEYRKSEVHLGKADQRAQYWKEWYNANLDHCKLRHWIHRAMKRKGESKTSWIDNIGCTKEEFKAHIESQFVEGMCWSNWTTNGWHMDHIRPLSKGGSNHYTNLQPLWWYDNLSKSDKIV